MALKALKHDRDTLQAQAREDEAHAQNLRSQLAKANTRCEALSAQISDAQAENARLCGHQNTKQKIQAHMQLKKDIQDQSNLLKVGPLHH